MFTIDFIYLCAFVGFATISCFHLSDTLIKCLDAVTLQWILHKCCSVCLASRKSTHELSSLLQAVTPDYILKEHSPNGTCCAMCVTSLHPRVTLLQGLLAEFLVTSILVLVLCSVFDRRNARNTDSVSIKFGLTVAAVAMNSVWFKSDLFCSS
jgi:glycerol uptake facilitator-like aquaporin